MNYKKAKLVLIVFTFIMILIIGIGLIVNHDSLYYCKTVSSVNNNTNQAGAKLITGYIVLEDDFLQIDELEIITTDDKDRIKELKLDEESEMPDGYYIYNENMKKQTFELTNETVYKFVDSDLLFVKDEDGDRLYTTTKQEEFNLHLNKAYSDRPPAQKVPFFVEIKDGKVISITEKFEYTI